MSDKHSMDVSQLRHSQVGEVLLREHLDDSPFGQFEHWFRDACDSPDLDPNAMALATVDDRGRAHNRTVLLKYFDDSGFVFYTNYASKKAEQIDANANVALLFFWRDLGRQVVIRGQAEKVSTAESLKYFATRPRGSQLGAWVSHQSSIITSRQLLEAKFEEMKHKFANKEVPLPSFWGGYRVVPEAFEFWQGKSQRLHDRFQYTRQDGDSWRIERLQP
jgi:pyridoxamine 5'-phosphate oxidase